MYLQLRRESDVEPCRTSYHVDLVQLSGVIDDALGDNLVDGVVYWFDI